MSVLYSIGPALEWDCGSEQLRDTYIIAAVAGSAMSLRRPGYDTAGRPLFALFMQCR